MSACMEAQGMRAFPRKLPSSRLTGKVQCSTQHCSGEQAGAEARQHHRPGRVDVGPARVGGHWLKALRGASAPLWPPTVGELVFTPVG